MIGARQAWGSPAAQHGGGRVRALPRRWRNRSQLGGRALACLVALLVLGVALRVLLVIAWRPAFLGYPDAGPYLADAIREPFWDPLRMVGYGLFLRALHGIAPFLLAPVVVQHLLGIASALLMVGVVRGFGAPAAYGLLPAAVVLLGGDQLLLEHAILSEALFVFLLAATLWCAARAREDLRWLAAAGLLAGIATAERQVGLVLLPLLAAWAALSQGGTVRRRALRLALPALAGGVVVLGYMGLHAHATGRFSLTLSGSYNLYGRTAVFADCARFTPPAGTRALCERRPPSRRPGPDFYNFLPGSPAHRLFGGSAQFPPPRADIAKLDAFARAAVLAQPLDYARELAREFARYIAPGSFAQHSGNDAAALVRRLTERPVTAATERFIVRDSYRGSEVAGSPAALRIVRAWERATRLRGPLMLVVVALALLAPLLAHGRARAGAALLLAVALALALVPIATIYYDIRYAIPVYPPLTAAAAIGAWALGARWRRSGRRAWPSLRAACARVTDGAEGAAADPRTARRRASARARRGR
jgi:hypothetical protein